MTAGANLDPMEVLREWPTLLTGIAAFLVTKAAVLYAEGPALGLTSGQAARVAFTLSGGGEFSFVIFKIAQDLGVLPNSLAKLLTASVIISMSLTPILGEIGDFIGNKIEELEGFTPPTGDELTEKEAEILFDEIDEDGSGSIEMEELRVALLKLNFQYSSIAEIFAAFDTNDDNVISRKEWKAGLDAGLLSSALDFDLPPVVERLAEPFSDSPVVICGFGKMGRSVYRMLETAGLVDSGGVVAFSLDSSRVAAAALSGAPVVFGDGARIDIFKAAGVRQPKAVVITYGSAERRLNATLRLRSSLPADTPILVRAGAGEKVFAKKLLDAGATEVVRETIESSLRFGSLLNVCETPEETERLRRVITDNSLKVAETNLVSDEFLEELAGELDISRSDISELYNLYTSFDKLEEQDEQGKVSFSSYRDLILRISFLFPVDVEDLECRIEEAMNDGDGHLSFDKFVRLACVNRYTIIQE